MSKRKRVIGTTQESIKAEEAKLNRTLPPSFAAWLLKNNGLCIDDISIFPVKDNRDIRKTWESLYHHYENNWKAWLENFDGDEMNLDHLLPFAEFGTGDYYCFDYNQISPENEPKVVLWSHETAETQFRADTFDEFIQKINNGDIDD